MYIHTYITQERRTGKRKPHNIIHNQLPGHTTLVQYASLQMALLTFLLLWLHFHQAPGTLCHRPALLQHRGLEHILVVLQGVAHHWWSLM